MDGGRLIHLFGPSSSSKVVVYGHTFVNVPTRRAGEGVWRRGGRGGGLEHQERTTRENYVLVLKDPNIQKVPKNAYLLRHRRNLQIFGVIPFVKLQNDT